MSKLRLLLIAVTVFTVSPIASARMTPRTSFAAKQNGTLNGVVLDSFSGRGLARAKVVIEGSEGKYTAVTDKDGGYRIELPSDVYHVESIRAGFCPARRSEFFLPPASSTEINFTLVACGISSVPVIENNVYKGETERKEEPFKYDSFQIDSPSNRHFTLLVRFGEGRETDTGTQYSGSMVGYLVRGEDQAEPVEERKYLQVTASYNTMTINADKLTVAKQDFQIVAEGHVVVEDGARSFTAKRIVVTFEAGTPNLTVTN